MTWPVILGSGKRLFPDSAADKAKLTLADCTTYANGVQLRIFRKRLTRGLARFVTIRICPSSDP